MQETSALWKEIWAGDNVRVETVVTIGGVEYTAFSNPVISRPLMQNGLSIGNAVSASCQFSLITDNVIPRSAEVAVKCRIANDTQVSEWLPAGTFYISKRTKDPVTGLITLECYDSLLKGNAPMYTVFPWTTHTGEQITNASGEPIYFGATYPRSMEDVARDIALMIGVELDSRNVIKTGTSYFIEKPEEETTVRDVLGKIAAANGGNWIITPQNKMRLVPVVSADDADEAEEDVIDVDGIVGSINIGTSGTITGLRCEVDGETHLAGDETGIVLDVDTSVSIMLDLADWMIGMTYQSYDLQNAIYDPAAELGDYVRAGANGEIRSALYSETATLGIAYRGNISAPESEELSDEYPYIGGSKRVLQVAKAYTRQVTQQLNESLDQEGVFNRLTNNGVAQGMYILDGQLYINGTYINTGFLNANLIRTGKIEDESGLNYWILNGSNSEFVTPKGIIGDFTLENGALHYNNIAVSAYLGKDGIYFGQSGNKPTKTAIFAQGLKFYWNGVEKTDLYLYQDGLEVLCYDENSARWLGIQLNCDEDGHTVYLGGNTRVNGKLRVDDELRARWTIYGERQLIVEGNVSAFADLQVYGTKSRVVETEDYSNRLLYCYETPSPMFADVGEGVISDDGRCYVWIDPMFEQTINASQYQVFLQAYGDGECWVSERHANYFVVEGSAGMAFGWELKARQRDFDQRRLDVPIDTVNDATTDFGELAQKHIETISKERMGL